MSKKESSWRVKRTKDGGLRWTSFPPYDYEQAAEKLRPVERAREFAASGSLDNNPNETQLTSVEHDMLGDVNDHINSLWDWHSQQTGAIVQDIVAAAPTATLEHEFTVINESFLSKLRNLTDSFRHDLQKRLRDLRKARIDLANFKHKNHIDREAADYPESKWLHFAWVLAALAAEGFANSSFFPQDLGIIGGFITAIGVSLGNVAISFIAGALFLRNLNHISVFRKVLGGFGFVVSLFVISFLHLTVAHYREGVARNPDQDILSIVPGVWDSPFALQDMESIVLIIIGVVISILAIWKGYTLDDKYPGFGPAYRKWKKIADEVNDEIGLFKLEAGEANDEARRHALEVLPKLKAREASLDGLRGAVDTYFACLAAYYEQATHAGRQLVVSFRDTLQVVSEDPDRYPINDELISNSLKPLDPWDEREKLEKMFSDRIAQLGDEISTYEQKRINLFREFDDQLQARTRDIERLELEPADDH
jgi:hypothetical protein